MALAPAQRLKMRVRVVVTEWKRETQRKGWEREGGSQSWWLRRRWRLNSSRRAPLQLAHYPAHCLILALLIHQRDCQGGRLSLSLSRSFSLFGPFGETFSDCVCIFNVAWPFGLYGRVGGGRRCERDSYNVYALHSSMRRGPKRWQRQDKWWCLPQPQRASWRIASAARWKKLCPLLVCDERVSTTIDKFTYQID